MAEHLNLLWFYLINADAGLHGWRLDLALFAAGWLILLVPIGLAGLWLRGRADGRQAAVKAAVAIVCVLAINAAIGLAWQHPRPFAIGIGHQFLVHAPNNSFPSDHGAIMFTAALTLAFSRAAAARRFGLALLPLAVAVAWARIFLGVHWPMDMLGALAVSLAVALASRANSVDILCRMLTDAIAQLYRRLLAAPIARGWLRP